MWEKERNLFSSFKKRVGGGGKSYNFPHTQNEDASLEGKFMNFQDEKRKKLNRAISFLLKLQNEIYVAVE